MHVIIRLLAATLLGAIVGFQRERAGKPAGSRTHILVCLGTAVFVLSCSGVGMSLDGLSRVIQGIVTGIGFIGAGSILKLSEGRDIQGLTTAAGVWMTAAIGVSVGLGSLGVALLSTLFTLIILAPDSPCDGYTAKHRAARIAEGDLPVSPRSPDRGRAHLEEAPGQARKASRSLPEIPQREPRVRRRRARSRPGGPGSSLSNMKVTRQGRRPPCRVTP